MPLQSKRQSQGHPGVLYSGTPLVYFPKATPRSDQMRILLSTRAYKGCLRFGFTLLFRYFPNFSKIQLGSKWGQLKLKCIPISLEKLEKRRISFEIRCFYGASVLIGLFKKRCHTNGFSDFRVADFLVFTLQAVTEMPKSKPTS